MINTNNLKENTLVTKELQELIDKAINDTLVITGKYITGPLFIKSNTNIVLEENACLIADINEDNYSLINTRVAGIEMKWYPAILNVIDATNVKISGKGTIDGNGEYWWNKYWGSDNKGGMRASYDKVGLRWACDYDCKRPRNVLVSNSNEVELQDFTSYNSGFWNVHVLYSHDIKLDGIKIKTIDKESPSTDGIDIDSSYNVVVENVITDCFDDSICIKSGRDYDGIRVGIPAHDITIKNSVINKGFGITIGSEVSGGIYNINISNITYNGTDCGFRIKSQKSRKGYIRNINIDNIIMTNVKYLFHLYTNWNEEYNKCVIPSNYKSTIKKHWEILAKEVDSNICDTVIENINISNIKASYTEGYNGISRAFNIEGFKDNPINNITFKNVNIKAKEMGFINYTTNISFDNCKLTFAEKENKANDEYDNR
ncbi:MAG: glycoside hydrolase family 28 protein [Anaeroplasmataceae bacterium]